LGEFVGLGGSFRKKEMIEREAGKRGWKMEGKACVYFS
jgi:hypothetical protein